MSSYELLTLWHLNLVINGFVYQFVKLLISFYCPDKYQLVNNNTFSNVKSLDCYLEYIYNITLATKVKKHDSENQTFNQSWNIIKDQCMKSDTI